MSTTSGTDVWVVVAALGSAVGGVGGAVAAVAAWRSAKASQESSREALDALAVGIRPTLSVRTQADVVDDKPTGEVSLTIANESYSWAASDLLLEVRCRDGEIDRHMHERMNPPGPGGGELWWVPVKGGKPSAEPANTSNLYGDTRERVERVVLTYSDERGIARYELPLTPAPEGMPFSAGPPFRQERRIK